VDFYGEVNDFYGCFVDDLGDREIAIRLLIKSALQIIDAITMVGSAWERNLPMRRMSASLLEYAAARCCCAVVAGMLLCGNTAQAQAPHWVGAWMAAPCPPDDVHPHANEFGLQAETVRQIVHLSIGGVAFRVRMSNAFGTAPLVVGPVFVGQRTTGPDVTENKPVTFGGKSDVTIAPGEWVESDAVNVPAAADSDLAVSFFVPGKLNAPAIHYDALQTSFVAKGDQAAAAALSSSHKISLDLILTGVDAATRTAPGAIVALGSSTTDGAHSTANANHRWPDYLSARLRKADGAAAPGVLNAGISGNRVLHDGKGSWGPIFGQSAVSRFTRDVLSEPGARYVVIFEGGNDLRQASSSESVSARQIIMGYELLTREAHERHIKVILGTITPFEGTGGSDDHPGWEGERLEVNDWIRKTNETDGVVDFDAAIRDPSYPSRILALYDSGDHLHPNDAGYQAMAGSINLNLFDTKRP
jgi:lysophospholipase L1-like esterase